jgi:hypothetical protein
MKPIFVLLGAAVCLVLSACSGLPQSLMQPTEPASVTSGTPAPDSLDASQQPASASGIRGDTVSYEIFAEGDPMAGTGQKSAAVAWRSGSDAPADLAGFPEEALAVLAQMRPQQKSDLYVAIYGGPQPSSRYAVKIISMTEADGKLRVLYQIEGPPPGEGAATVMTHPYVIARVAETALQPADVVFVEQSSPR